jgi:hypothetical protein
MSPEAFRARMAGLLREAAASDPGRVVLEAVGWGRRQVAGERLDADEPAPGVLAADGVRDEASAALPGA